MFYTSDVAIGSQNKSKTMRFPAPVRGLIKNENIAMTKPAGAVVMENWFPTSTGIRTRRGLRKHATLEGSSPVASVMPYQAASLSKLFAANDSGIFDITTVANPNTVLTAISGIGTCTSGAFSYTQFTTSGGPFLVCVNGVDLHKIYDGAAWVENTPAITGTTTDNWSHCWTHQNRLFGVKKNSQTAVYLPVDNVGGVATSFPLGGVFKLGGDLLSGATWSLDSGAGLTTNCVFISTEGEVAIYAGSDPATWALQGVYKIGRPMGKNALFKAGGDLVVATVDGLIPISAAISRDQAALQQVAVSYPIEELWLQQTTLRSAQAWQCATWPQKQMLVVSTPTYGGASNQVLVANTRTGAWTVFTGGWDCRGMAVLGASFYFGASNSVVYEAEQAASDNGAPYTCRVAGLFDDIKAPALQKIAKVIRGVFQSLYQDFTTQFSTSVDFQTNWPSNPATIVEPTSSGLWGSALWGSFIWGGKTQRYRKVDWQSVDGVGASISWQLQVTLGNMTPPDIELAAIDLVYETGEAVA
jgi:hypothetical protein